MTPTAPTTTIVPFQLTSSVLYATDYNPGKSPVEIRWDFKANKPMTVTVSITGPNGAFLPSFPRANSANGSYPLCGCTPGTAPGEYRAQALVVAADGSFRNTFNLPQPLIIG